MYSFCRLCLKQDETYTFLQFSSYLNDALSVEQCYKLFTSICLKSNSDKNESKICPDCLQKLSTFYQYRCLVIKNNNFILRTSDIGEILNMIL